MVLKHINMGLSLVERIECSCTWFGHKKYITETLKINIKKIISIDMIFINT